MGLMDNLGEYADKAKDLAGDHPDKVNEGLDKAADMIGEKTGDQIGDQIDMGAEKAKDFLGTDGEQQ
ncbi:MAG: antitoxin [Micromonosporaceae bacterium]